MAGKNQGKLRIGLPDPDLSKNWGGLPDLDLDPTRFLSRYYPPRDILPIAAFHPSALIVEKKAENNSWTTERSRPNAEICKWKLFAFNIALLKAGTEFY